MKKHFSVDSSKNIPLTSLGSLGGYSPSPRTRLRTYLRQIGSALTLLKNFFRTGRAVADYEGCCVGQAQDCCISPTRALLALESMDSVYGIDRPNGAADLQGTALSVESIKAATAQLRELTLKMQKACDRMENPNRFWNGAARAWIFFSDWRSAKRGRGQ